MVSGENYPAHVIVVVFLVRDCKTAIDTIICIYFVFLLRVIANKGRGNHNNNREKKKKN